MRFPGEGGGACRLPLHRVPSVLLPGPAEAVEVVDDSGACVFQQCHCVGVRIGCVEQAIQLGLREVNKEASERIPFHRCRQRLAHHRGAHHHAQRIEGNLGLVAVRVAN